MGNNPGNYQNDARIGEDRLCGFDSRTEQGQVDFYNTSYVEHGCRDLQECGKLGQKALILTYEIISHIIPNN
jgi:hypothetical protein